MINGTPRINGIAVGEVSVSFIGGVTEMQAKAAFINSDNGLTHGWTEHKSWSPATLQRLMELKSAIEEDLAAVHFEDGATASSPQRAGLRQRTTGLDELDEAPSV